MTIKIKIPPIPNPKIPEVITLSSNPIAEGSNPVHENCLAHLLFGCNLDTSACKYFIFAWQSDKCGARIENKVCVGGIVQTSREAIFSCHNWFICSVLFNCISSNRIYLSVLFARSMVKKAMRTRNTRTAIIIFSNCSHYKLEQVHRRQHVLLALLFQFFEASGNFKK